MISDLQKNIETITGYSKNRLQVARWVLDNPTYNRKIQMHINVNTDAQFFDKYTEINPV
jgi:hypothetical protein